MSEWRGISQPMRYIVDLDAPLTVRRDRGVLVQGDQNANSIIVIINKTMGVPADLTGCTVTLHFVRPDNHEVIPIAAEVNGNVAVATLTDPCYRVSGMYAAMVTLTKDGSERTILKTMGDIISTENSGMVSDEQIVPPTPVELLETLRQVEEARDSANAAANAANSAAVGIDEKVESAENRLSESITEIATIERWNMLYGAELHHKTYLSVSGSTLDDVFLHHDSFFTFVVPVDSEKIYHVFTEFSAGEQATRWAGVAWFLDENKNTLSMASNPTGDCVTPAGCAYVAYHSKYIDIPNQDIGECWFTSKDADERFDTYNTHGKKVKSSDVDGFVEYEIDTTLTKKGAVAESEATGKAIEKAIRNSSGHEIQPKRFPRLPYKVYKTNGGYVLEDTIENIKNIKDFRQIYVDSANGSDTNNGETESTAYKTLKQALSVYKTAKVDCCVNIANDAVFYSSELYAELNTRKSLAIIAGNSAKLIHGDLLSWDVLDSESNTFTATAPYTPVAVVDMSNEDNDGLYKGMKSVSSIDLCKSTENSYHIEETSVYVHPVKKADSVIVLKDGYGVRWNHLTSNADHFLFLKNLNIIGGYFDAARSAAFPVDGVKIEFFAENCILQHNTMGDGFPHNGYDVSYNINCKCGFSKADCFNHHHSGVKAEVIDNSVIVDINCVAREAGYYSKTQSGNNNLFTCHDGENVMRLNCNGINAGGPLFADVNGCRSVLVDCESWNVGYSGVAQHGSWQFNNVSARKNGFVTLENCRVYDNRNNVRIKSECDIEIKNTDVFTNCNITGEITTFTDISY